MALARFPKPFIAAAVTALICAIIGGLIYIFVPWGCATRVGKTIYLWACVMPFVLITVCPVLAIALGLLAWLSARAKRFILRHPILTMFLSGAGVYLSIMGVYAVMLDEAYRRLFFWEAILIPQPFVAGVFVAALFVEVLRKLEPNRAH